MKGILKYDDLFVVTFDDGPHAWQYKGRSRMGLQPSVIVREDDGGETEILVREFAEVTGLDVRLT